MNFFETGINSNTINSVCRVGTQKKIELNFAFDFEYNKQ